MNLDLAISSVNQFLNELGWNHVPEYKVYQKTDGSSMLGYYEVNSQFSGAASIYVDLKTISGFEVTDPQEALESTILHELAHVAHEACSDQLDYPELTEHFQDEEDMCEWFCWGIVFGVEDTLRHPYFSNWLRSVDSYYLHNL